MVSHWNFSKFRELISACTFLFFSLDLNVYFGRCSCIWKKNNYHLQDSHCVPHVSNQEITCRSWYPDLFSWSHVVVMFRFVNFILGCILWLYQTLGLFKSAHQSQMWPRTILVRGFLSWGQKKNIGYFFSSIDSTLIDEYQ